MANILACSLCRLEKLFFPSARSAVFSSCTAQCNMLVSCLAMNTPCASVGGVSCSCSVCSVRVSCVWAIPPVWTPLQPLARLLGACGWLLSSLAALQSPIEYQRKESSSAVLRPQAGRVPQPNTRPHSSIPVGSEKPLKATSRNPSLPPLKLSTSNGSTGYEHSQPGDKYEQSKVLSSSDKTWSHSPFLTPQVIHDVSFD